MRRAETGRRRAGAAAPHNRQQIEIVEPARGLRESQSQPLPQNALGQIHFKNRGQAERQCVEPFPRISIISPSS